MFKLVCTGGPFGDATSNYKVVFDQECTVREFFKAILKKGNEWGVIDIRIDQAENHPYMMGSCDYSHDKLSGNIPKDWLDRTIDSATASGGWSRMDYNIKLRDDQCEPKTTSPEKEKNYPKALSYFGAIKCGASYGDDA